MVFQHRLDGFLVARMHRRPKSVVCRQKGRALAQTLGVLLQQAQPHVFVHIELARNLAAGVALDAGAHHGKPGQLHDQQQQQGHPHQAQDQATAEDPPHQGANPTSLAAARTLPVAGTATGCSWAAAPGAMRGCQTRSL